PSIARLSSRRRRLSWPEEEMTQAERVISAQRDATECRAVLLTNLRYVALFSRQGETMRDILLPLALCLAGCSGQLSVSDEGSAVQALAASRPPNVPADFVLT